MIKLLILLITVWLLAQVIKFTIDRIKNRKYSFFENGGFPSSHIAVVSALTTAIFLKQGFSDLFIVTLVFSMIVFADAIGIRKTVMDISKELNQKGALKKYYRSGHTIAEALGGLILGIATAIIFRFFLPF